MTLDIPSVPFCDLIGLWWSMIEAHIIPIWSAVLELQDWQTHEINYPKTILWVWTNRSVSIVKKKAVLFHCTSKIIWSVKEATGGQLSREERVHSDPMVYMWMSNSTCNPYFVHKIWSKNSLVTDGDPLMFLFNFCGQRYIDIDQNQRLVSFNWSRNRTIKGIKLPWPGKTRRASLAPRRAAQLLFSLLAKMK